MGHLSHKRGNRSFVGRAETERRAWYLLGVSTEPGWRTLLVPPKVEKTEQTTEGGMVSHTEKWWRERAAM